MDMITLKDPRSPISEVYRTLRTSIKFASFAKEIKAIAITSAGLNEGKSTIVCNLGITMAQSGNKVLILEGDLRNPTIHKKFSLVNNSGVSNILIDNAPYKLHTVSTEIEGLDVITCGPKPPNPAELLGSERMKNLILDLKRDYDYILVDTPPVVVVTDAALISCICDGTILVIGSGEALIDAAVKAKELLQSANANIIGAVLNKVKTSGPGTYYNYYGYYYNDESQVKRRTRKHSAKRRPTNV